MNADKGRHRPLVLAIALRIVRLTSVVVPRVERAEWRREWEAELVHRWGSLRGQRQLSWRTSMDLIRRAFGALPDAAWIRRQFTADADLVHDIRHTLRLLARTPGVTAIALLVFAIGIGATTAIVSLADTLLARPLPLPDAERIVTLWERNRATGVEREDVAPGNAIDWVQRARSYRAIAAIEPWSVDYTGGVEPEAMLAAKVSEGFFDVLGVPMLHGRAFLPQEYRRGGDRVVVLGHAVWERKFGADPALVGRAVQLDGEPHTVVGVMPPGIELRMFEARGERAMWLPKYFEDYEPKIRGSGYWNVCARLKPDTTVEEARAELEALSAQLASEYPGTNQNTVGQIVPLRSHLAGTLHALVPLLIGAATLVLVVACANVANILIARGAVRGREFAVRQALGAGRGRVIRQMLAESLLLATVGGALGLLIARWSLDLIARLRPTDVAGVDHIPLDARAAAIALGVTLLAAVDRRSRARGSTVPSCGNDCAPGRPERRRAARPPGSARRGRGRARAAARRRRRPPRSKLRADPARRSRVPDASRSARSRFSPSTARTRSPRGVRSSFNASLEGIRSLPGIAAAGAVIGDAVHRSQHEHSGLLAVVGRPPAAAGRRSRGFS